jgi:GNAT superfamily N-acetyltransferase
MGRDRSQRISFHRATAEDAEALARIHNDAWCEAYGGLLPEAYLKGFTMERRRERFLNSLAADAEETYLVSRDGEALGFLTIGACRDADLNSLRTGEVGGIYLAPRIWRQGYGRYLVVQAERLLRAQGYKQAAL